MGVRYTRPFRGDPRLMSTRFPLASKLSSNKNQVSIEELWISFVELLVMATNSSGKMLNEKFGV